MGDGDAIPDTVAWRDEAIELIDQRRLPAELVMLRVGTVADLVDAIRDLAVRGAPALGVTGAFGVALAAITGEDVPASAAAIVSARPTAVNLAWGVERALAAFQSGGAPGTLDAARALAAADVAANRALGAHGARLLPSPVQVLTHCNAGALACVGYGTALGVVRAVHEAGRPISVWVGETRPVLQGSRLTAWELARLGIPHRVVVDGAAGSLMAARKVDAVVVGADRIAANGDVANKIGTYGLAVLARAHEIPFYIAAPQATIDPAAATGADIPIEHRDGEEVRRMGSWSTTGAASQAHNPAFDVTPAALVTAYVTEFGAHHDPADLPVPMG